MNFDLSLTANKYRLLQKIFVPNFFYLEIFFTIGCNLAIKNILDERGENLG